MRRSRQVDHVVRRRDPAGERWARDPDVLDLDQTPARRHVAAQGFAHPPGRPSFRADDIDELGVRGHADGERRPEGDPRPRPRALGPGHGQSRGVDRGDPGIDQLTLRLLGRARIARDHEAPTLARLRGAHGGLGHVW